MDSEDLAYFEDPFDGEDSALNNASIDDSSANATILDEVKTVVEFMIDGEEEDDEEEDGEDFLTPVI